MRARIKWIVHSSTFEQTHEDTHVCGFCYHKSSAERHCRYHKKERNCHNNSIYEPLNDIIIIIFFIPLLFKCCGKDVLMFVLTEIFYYIFVEIRYNIIFGIYEIFQVVSVWKYYREIVDNFVISSMLTIVQLPTYVNVLAK